MDQISDIKTRYLKCQKFPPPKGRPAFPKQMKYSRKKFRNPPLFLKKKKLQIFGDTSTFARFATVSRSNIASI